MIRRFNVLIETEDMNLEPADIKRLINFHCAFRNLKAIYITEDSYQKLMNIAEKRRMEDSKQNV